MPKPSLHIPKFLRPGRSRSQKQPQTESRDAVGISSTSCPSKAGTAEHAQADLVTAAHSNASDSAGQLNSNALLVTSPVIASNSQDRNSGLLHVGHSAKDFRNVSVEGNMNNVNYTNTVVNNSNQFMEKLLKETIQGAAFDSSARDPPPRCHPGTRLAVIDRCLKFIADCVGREKVRWVVGAAGVGKSAIMQNVAESSLPSVSQRVSVFLSINGRNDGTKLILTLAYQLAARSQFYRDFIELEIARDPSLLQSSMSTQFKKFIIEALITHPIMNSIGRILIIVDGLDECDKLHTQRELLQLVFDACSAYPSSPIVWIIASRPEPHITSFFAQGHLKAIYEKEEIEVDSDEARRDVERFLRAELTKIQHEFSLSPRSQWPQEQDFWRLASASGGLFVYAQTVAKYIGDPVFGNPTSQLDDVLKVIDAYPLLGVPREQHPMALLDALYARILSKIPERVMVNTRKILLSLVLDSTQEAIQQKKSFLALCNWLDMSCDDAYAAIRHLYSVLVAPGRDVAHQQRLKSFHKSFIDYISDSARSGFSPNIVRGAHQLEIQCAFRILQQAPDGVDFADMDYNIWDRRSVRTGALARGPGTGADISLIWPIDEATDWSNNEMRLDMYRLAVSNIVEGIRKGEPLTCTEFCLRLVTTRLLSYDIWDFPLLEVQNLAFERSQRHEFMQNGLLKQVPVEALDYTCIEYNTYLHFYRPSSTTSSPGLGDPWDPSCRHDRTGKWRKGQDEDWTTTFVKCTFCYERLNKRLEIMKTRFPDHLVTIFFTLTARSFVEFQFIDPDDGVSEWTYRFVYKISEQERKKLGSAV